MPGSSETAPSKPCGGKAGGGLGWGHGFMGQCNSFLFPPSLKIGNLPLGGDVVSFAKNEFSWQVSHQVKGLPSGYQIGRESY